MGMYADFLNRRCRKHKAEITTVLSIPDPAGEEKPMKVSVKGVADNTDAALAELVRSQEEVKIASKQKMSETETLISPTIRRTWDKNELADSILARRAFVDAVAQNRLEAFLSEEEKAARDADEKLSKIKEEHKTVNRVKDKVAVNVAK